MKELTLKNVQVDCSNLTAEQVKEMADVFENNGFTIGNLEVFSGYHFLSNFCYSFCTTSVYNEHRTTITYEKFMELFAPKYEVTMIAEKPKSEMKTFKVIEYSTGDFMDLGKEAGIIKAIDEDKAWELYKETHRLRDREKGFYSFVEIKDTNHPLSPVIEKAKEISENINKVKAFKDLVEVLNEELTEEHDKEEKPQHYSKGIDTFARMEANCTKEECLAFAKGNIDKYNWRTKGQDLEDFKKIKAYANWAIKLLENGK